MAAMPNPATRRSPAPVPPRTPAGGATLSLALCRELPAVADGALPDWLLLAPAGRTTGADGRSFALADPGAVVAAHEREHADIPLDWEHATHIRAPQGLDAPAAGWITSLQVREGAVWGQVAWTPAGAEAVRARAYRYYSPAYYHDDAGNIRGIPSVGLTGKPNLAVPALNQQQPGADPGAIPEIEIHIEVGPADQEPPEMLVPAPLAAALGLPADCTPDAAVAAVETLKSERTVALNRAAVPDLALYVPRADHDAALNRAASAETLLRQTQEAETTRQVDALIQEGLAAARITPATVDYHRAQAQTAGGIERLRAYLGTAPAVVTDASRGKPPPEGTLALNSEEARIAAAFGNTPETLAKYGAQQ